MYLCWGWVLSSDVQHPKRYNTTNEVLRKVIKKKELRTMNTVSFESPLFRVLKLRHRGTGELISEQHFVSRYWLRILCIILLSVLVLGKDSASLQIHRGSMAI